MSREQAETYLRQLAESELRQLRAADADRAGRYLHAPKLLLAAQALSAVGAIDAGTAWHIRADADFALAARQPRQSQPPSPTARRLHRSLPVQPPLAVGQALPAAVRARPRPAGSVPWRVVSVGQVIPGAAPNGDVTVLAYLEGPAGARFAITGGIPGFPGQLTATDDQGANYHLRLMRGPRTGVLELLPGPAHPVRWLDVLTASGGIAARFDLDSADQHSAAEGSVDGRPRPEVTMARTATSPGELMLDVIAARILATAPVPRPAWAGHCLARSARVHRQQTRRHHRRDAGGRGAVPGQRPARPARRAVRAPGHSRPRHRPRRPPRCCPHPGRACWLIAAISRPSRRAAGP